MEGLIPVPALTPQRVSQILARAGHQRSRRLSAWEHSAGFEVRQSYGIPGAPFEAVTVGHVLPRNLSTAVPVSRTPVATMLSRYAATLADAGYSARLSERGNYLIVTTGED